MFKNSLRFVLLFFVFIFWGCSTTGVLPNIGGEIDEPKTKISNEEFEKKINSLLKENKKEEVVNFSKEYCDYKLPAACHTLGRIHAKGFYNIPKDLNIAKGYFQKACKMDYSKSCYNLGAVYKMQGDDKKANELFLKSSNSGDPRGDYYLAMSSLKSDKNSAKIYLNRSCEANFAKACTKLAMLLRQTNEKERALFYDNKACELDDSLGCFNAGVTNYMDKKYEDSLKNFIKGCNLGSYQSCERAQDLIQKDPILSKEEKEELLNSLQKTIEENKTRSLNDEA